MFFVIKGFLGVFEGFFYVVGIFNFVNVVWFFCVGIVFGYYLVEFIFDDFDCVVFDEVIKSVKDFFWVWE